MILLQLQDGVKVTPHLQLFLLQRLKKMSQAAIKRSIELQRQMWLEYCEKKPARVHRLQPVARFGRRRLIPAMMNCSSTDIEGG